MSALALAGCLDNGPPPNPGSSGSAFPLGATGATSGGGGTSSTTDTQCAVFQSNSKDYQVCLGCKNTYCTCAISQHCTSSELGACTVNTNTLVACVHNNVASAGGPCTGLTCGAGQIANFSTCSCQDATPPSSIGTAPGQDDTLTPYVEPGFAISTRYCPLPDVASTAPNGGVSTDPTDCYAQDLGVRGSSTYQGAIPRYLSQAPVNVFQDVGYIRWDLGIDASQFSPAAAPVFGTMPFLGSYSTIPATFSMYYQLKPNTVLTAGVSKTYWQDCAEHFSGPKITTSGASLGYLSTNNVCDLRTGSATLDASTAVPVPLNPVGLAGALSIQNVSLNGDAANANITSAGSTGNLPLDLTSTAAGYMPLGLAKQDTGNAPLGNTVPVITGTAMLANLGYYKYSWGPIRVARPSAPATDVASATVTGRIAFNTNLGFTPASAVESTALSPDAITNQILTRDCSTDAIIPHPCVVTAAYRTSGGAVLTQSYSPRFSQNNGASTINALPSGVTAVSTPKIVEDIAEDISTTNAQPPARLRVFVRAADGNIYMSRFEGGQWNQWMSLGRPWSCNTNDSACVSQIGTPPLVYAPFSLPPTNYSTTAPNNGISIAGEPVVVSYMDKTKNPVQGVIAVFVRVSNLNSSNGALGPFHNAVFYTYAYAASGPISPGQQRSFDNPLSWSAWTPVYDGTNLFQIQGNPTAFVSTADKTSNGTIAFRLFGSALVAGGITYLHPPSPPSIGNNIVTYSNGIPKAANAHYYGYATKIARTALYNPPQNVATANHYGKWKTIDTGDSAYNEQGFLGVSTDHPIVSDLSFSYVQPSDTVPPPGPLNKSSRIRVLANVLVSMVCDTSTADLTNANGGKQQPITKPVSPCIYRNGLAWREYDLDSSQASGYAQAAPCATANFGLYYNIHFNGTPWPVNLMDLSTSSTSSTAPNAATYGDPNNPSLHDRLFLFGRAPCTDIKKCDPVNPQFTYATVYGASECLNTGITRQSACNVTNAYNNNTILAPAATPRNVCEYHAQYFPGGGMNDLAFSNFDVTSSGSSFNLTSTFTVPGFNATSDVTPVYSHALDYSNVDVPVYFFVRDPNGKLNHGYWPGTTNGNGILGPKMFQIFQTGAFVN